MNMLYMGGKNKIKTGSRARDKGRVRRFGEGGDSGINLRFCIFFQGLWYKDHLPTQSATDSSPARLPLLTHLASEIGPICGCGY